MSNNPLINATINMISTEAKSRGWRLIPVEHAERLAKLDEVAEKGFRTGWWPKLPYEGEHK